MYKQSLYKNKENIVLKTCKDLLQNKPVYEEEQNLFNLKMSLYKCAYRKVKDVKCINVLTLE